MCTHREERADKTFLFCQSTADETELTLGDMVAVGSANLTSGDLIHSRFEVVSRLGYGSFGTTYQVIDQKTGGLKAIKVLDESLSQDEGVMGAVSNTLHMVRINHPNILRIHDVSRGEMAFIEMDYVEGRNLDEVIRQSPDGKLTEAEAMHYAKEMAQGLAYAHASGITHLDLKPSNVLVAKDQGVTLCDFGVTGKLWFLGHYLHGGLRRYIAPEVIHGIGVGKTSDIYSFGAVLYEMLTGRPPFSGEDGAIQTLTEKPLSMEGVSRELSSVVMKCLEKDSKKRFGGFDEVLVALEAVLGIRKLAEKRSYRNSGRLMSLALLFVCGALLVGLGVLLR